MDLGANGFQTFRHIIMPSLAGGVRVSLAESTDAFRAVEALAAGFMPPWGASWLYPVWSALNGGQIFDATNNLYTVNSAENVEWIEYWAKWLNDAYGGDFEQINIAGTASSRRCCGIRRMCSLQTATR